MVTRARHPRLACRAAIRAPPVPLPSPRGPFRCIAPPLPGTRRLFDEDYDMMREMTRKFYENECAPHHEQWEKDGAVSRDLWKSAGANGLLGIPMPEEYGGPGGDILQASIMWEEQGASGFTGPGFAIHSGASCFLPCHRGSLHPFRNRR